MSERPLEDADFLHADWSTNGRQVTFEALFPDGRASIWTVDADGTDARERFACRSAACLQMSWPDWSPDGRYLLGVRYDAKPNGDWGNSCLEVLDLVTKAVAVWPTAAAFKLNRSDRAYTTLSWPPGSPSDPSPRSTAIPTG